MTGIFLLIVVGLWIWACVAITHLVLRRIDARWWRWPLALVVFGLLLVVPVIDEIIGGFQFRSLCEKGAVLTIDAEKTSGKTVRVVIEPSNEVVAGQALRTLRSHYSYQAVGNGEEVASYDTYAVNGGWFIRALGISESSSPLLIGAPYCGPPKEGSMDKTYGFTLTNK